MKKVPIILLALALVVSLTVVAQPPALAADFAGPSYPRTVSISAEDPYDDVDWTNPGHVEAADGAYAEAANIPVDGYSHVLRATDFGFDIPAGATIEGIKVEIHRYGLGSTPRVRDALVHLTKDGTTAVGENKAAPGVNWDTSLATAEYGGDDDLWLTTWTADDINATGFGLHLAIKNHHHDSARTGRVDFIRIMVYYTPPHTISGTITVNSGLENVEVVATGGHEQTVYTDEHGYYELTGAVHEATGITITPTLEGYEFAPELIEIAGPVTDDIDEQDFTATALIYSISGTILDDEDDPVADVSVEATGGHDQTVTTGADGTYELTDVAHGATAIVITPTLAGYTFDPPSTNVPGPVTANVEDEDFTAIALTYTISGTILDDEDDPVADVSVEATGGHDQTVTTGADGTYELTDVAHGAENIVITPTLEGYSFEPEARTLDGPVEADVEDEDFTAIALTYTISGTILDDEDDPVADVSVEATGGHDQTVTTGADGTYELTDVAHGAENIVITPTLAGYTFDPPDITLEGPVTANVEDQDFIAIDTPPESATINPDEGYYNFLDGHGVTTTITWNDASEIDEIWDNVHELQEGPDYTVTDIDGDTATLTILDDYLADKLEACGDYVELTITFDEGDPATFTISVYPVYNEDTNTGYETIQEAIDDASDGDTIIVCPGTYNEDLYIDDSLTLKSAGGKDVTTITGLVTIDLDDGQTVVFGGEEDNGFTIDRGNPVGDSGILLSVDNGAEVTISRNTITGTDTGIRTKIGGVIAGGSTLTIEHNEVSDNSGDGIYLELVHDSTVIILANIIGGDTPDDGNRGAGIRIGQVEDSTVIIGGDTEDVGNTISHNGAMALATGIHIDAVTDDSGVTVEYNTITDNNGAGIFIRHIGLTPRTVTIVRNTITGNTGHGIDVGEISDSTLEVFDSIIAGNGEDGINIDAVREGGAVFIQGNRIGAWQDGEWEVEANVLQGIHVGSLDDGSALSIDDNVINANGADGLYIGPVTGDSTVDITANTIGGDEEDEGNEGPGIHIHEIRDSTVTIGGDTEAKGNTISHNCRVTNMTGLRIENVEDSDVTIEYNTITDNNGAGIDIGLSVGVVTIAHNIIAGNDGSGIHAETVSDSTLVIVENTITDNEGSGIDIDDIEGALETVAIARNVIADNGHYGIDIGRIYLSTVVIDQNKAGAWEEWKGNDYGGINIGEVLNGSNVQITENHANENCADEFGIQINIIDGSTVAIEGNETNQNVRGILVHNVRNSGTLYVMGNTIAENEVGLDVVGVEDSTVVILGNWIEDNKLGVVIGGVDNSTCSINFNNIFGNTEWGVVYEDNPTLVDATHNWWGDASGPEHEDNPYFDTTEGDAVSDNVLFFPWLGAAITLQPTGCTADRGYGENASAETDNVSADATGGDDTTTVTLAEYVGNPTDKDPGFVINGEFFFDVHVGGTEPDTLVVEVKCPGDDCSGMELKWFNGDDWHDVDPVSYTNGTIVATLTDTSSPTIAQLTGTPFALGSPEAPPVLPPVGGTGHLVNMPALLAPWLALAAMIAGAAVFARRRLTQS